MLEEKGAQEGDLHSLKRICLLCKVVNPLVPAESLRHKTGG